MKKIKFAIGIHNHQPVGNFDFVFEEAYRKAYLPFLEVLAQHPKIKIAQHYTGVLFEWLLQRDPNFGARLRQLVSVGQVEMMSGGYYEPILINIPDEDKLGQIEKLNRFVYENTGYQPIGLWLAERIWEPHLPRPLSQTGAKYVVIDDSHFKTAGLDQKELFGYYMTEDNGHAINIFPISEKLRYTMPFQEPEATIDYLRSIATEEGDKLVVFADDGEKFGIWPGTYQHCYEDRWLERFFVALEQNLDWIELLHFSEVLAKMPPVGRVYLPTASYREMMEWALPAPTIERYEQFEKELKNKQLFDNFKEFVRGGFWRNFLAKYPESNNLHKKSLWVSRKVNRLIGDARYDQKLAQQARDHLWAGQTNCPYWHGVFGGLYLNNLRHAVYKNMIQAEAIVDQLVHTPAELEQGWTQLQITDFDVDGSNELVAETKVYNLYFAPHVGGTLFEMDYKPKAVNLLDTMTRRKEAYHNKLLAIKDQTATSSSSGVASIHDLVIAKEPGLEKKLHYDRYRRTSLIDHFLAADTQLDQLARCDYQEAGDFVSAAYNYETELTAECLNIRMHRVGLVAANGLYKKISLSKTISIFPNSPLIKIFYQIKNLATVPVALWFGPEFNIALLAGNAPDRYYYFDQDVRNERHLASSGIVKSVRQMGLKDEWQKLDVQFRFDRPTTVWRFPIETISQSEGGFERVYQSSVIVPNWKLKLDASEEWSVEIHQLVLDI
ncbi:MAG: DUF1926 domain-containing protein [candidate division KSB1 bacterium]|nr:DUF1926 domain-containing protein [candidate division KSB1 bacterium]